MLLPDGDGLAFRHELTRHAIEHSLTPLRRRQLHAISEEIDRVLERELGDQRLGIEGYNESRWILLDYGSVVVHLFDADTRSYYALEDLWAHAQPVPLPWQ